jgi:hypothetical protein
MALPVRFEAGAEPPGLSARSETAGLTGLRDGVRLRQRHQRAGRGGGRRGPGTLLSGAPAPCPVGRLGGLRPVIGSGGRAERTSRRPVPGAAGRPLTGRRGGEQGRHGQPLPPARGPGRIPGARALADPRHRPPRTHRLRAEPGPRRAVDDDPAGLRRRRRRPAGPDLRGRHAPSQPGRRPAQRGLHGGRQPQLLQQRVDTGAGDGSGGGRRRGTGPRVCSGQHHTVDGRSATGRGRHVHRRGGPAVRRGRRPGTPAAGRLEPAGAVGGPRAGAQPRRRRAPHRRVPTEHQGHRGRRTAVLGGGGPRCGDRLPGSRRDGYLTALRRVGDGARTGPSGGGPAMVRTGFSRTGAFRRAGLPRRRRGPRPAGDRAAQHHGNTAGRDDRRRFRPPRDPRPGPCRRAAGERRDRLVLGAGDTPAADRRDPGPAGHGPGDDAGHHPAQPLRTGLADGRLGLAPRYTGRAPGRTAPCGRRPADGRRRGLRNPDPPGPGAPLRPGRRPGQAVRHRSRHRPGHVPPGAGAAR